MAKSKGEKYIEDLKAKAAYIRWSAERHVLRNTDITVRVLGGESCASVGACYGIGWYRVEQIVNRYCRIADENLYAECKDTAGVLTEDVPFIFANIGKLRKNASGFCANFPNESLQSIANKP